MPNAEIEKPEYYRETTFCPGEILTVVRWIEKNRDRKVASVEDVVEVILPQKVFVKKLLTQV